MEYVFVVVDESNGMDDKETVVDRCLSPTTGGGLSRRLVDATNARLYGSRVAQYPWNAWIRRPWVIVANIMVPTTQRRTKEVMFGTIDCCFILVQPVGWRWGHDGSHCHGKEQLHNTMHHDTHVIVSCC